MPVEVLQVAPVDSGLDFPHSTLVVLLGDLEDVPVPDEVDDKEHHFQEGHPVAAVVLVVVAGIAVEEDLVAGVVVHVVAWVPGDSLAVVDVAAVVEVHLEGHQLSVAQVLLVVVVAEEFQSFLVDHHEAEEHDSGDHRGPYVVVVVQEASKVLVRVVPVAAAGQEPWEEHCTHLAVEDAPDDVVAYWDRVRAEVVPAYAVDGKDAILAEDHLHRVVVVVEEDHRDVRKEVVPVDQDDLVGQVVLAAAAVVDRDVHRASWEPDPVACWRGHEAAVVCV